MARLTRSTRSTRSAGLGWALAVSTSAVTLLVGSGTFPATAAQPRTQHRGVLSVSAVPPPLLPNFVTMQAQDLSIQMVDGSRRLRFTSTLANIGRGPSEVRPTNTAACPPGQRHASQVVYRDVDRSGRFNRQTDVRTTRRPAGCMLFHAAHDHWHFDAAARYAIFDPRSRRIVASHPKTSFCLRDIRRVPDRWGVTTAYPKHYGGCERDTPQGISIGWADVYESYLAGQSLRLPNRLRDGVYCLRITVDPLDQLRETDNADNRSAKAFQLRGNTVSLASTRPCLLPEQR